MNQVKQVGSRLLHGKVVAVHSALEPEDETRTELPVLNEKAMDTTPRWSDLDNLKPKQSDDTL
jgi:hypothetical protein